MKHHNFPRLSRKILFAVLLLGGQLLTLVALPAPANACTQLPTQWWYREKMTITEDILPEAVSVSLSYNDYARSRHALVLSNSSPETLYILAPAGSADYYSGVEPAAVPQNLIVHTTVNQLDSHFQMEQLARLDNSIVDSNSWLPARPDNPVVPASQSTRIDMLFAGQLYFVNVAIEYEINESFNPSQGNAGCPDLYQAPVEQEVSNNLTLTLMGAFGLFTLASAIYLYRRRPKQGKWLE